ncbi:helix-turn-helix domain-containing protein [Azospirillum sp. RWY-5-1]|uniref:Helix-turn-helix domain-containing protein n=1 Tax=Azospirillum oleiclasticum TaxID=2735135 RepID=A0ABX2TGF0_9PROT|nr:helix-turn-helix domain-containing protein [Azospirillum oleiclasticum]NYZ16776.1 helix-turn-helix domain-containing protein [Azospirillum oleiclasticum]NYZ23323.1 helix-turn-helix domain-containing protein [Azospirillum oleiclasticum]
MIAHPKPLHVSLIAFPDAVASTLTGIHDVLGSFGMLAGLDDAIPETPPFTVEIVGAAPGPVMLASGIPVVVQRATAAVETTDIVIVPSVLVGRGGWAGGRYPELVGWADRMHRNGALLCSACSGIFLLAETGLFDGRPATVHWGYAKPFRSAFPRVPVLPERVLVVSGEREELVTSGASMTWHDLVLYLIARHVGATAAQAVARFFALQWHQEGLAPYIVFRGRTDHGDATVADAQVWLEKNFAVANPVEEMVRRSGMAERTFKRHFTLATGHPPLEYAQRLRVEDAKRRLERTEAPIDEIGWRVGYEDPAFFRRLFKRTTGLSPGAYRRKFRVPAFAGDRPS